MNLSEELEKMRDAFLKRCVDFRDFQQDQGYYFDEERRYKDALILKAKTILDGPEGGKPENVGLKFLELVKQSNFVGWQAFDAIARPAESQQKWLNGWQ